MSAKVSFLLILTGYLGGAAEAQQAVTVKAGVPLHVITTRTSGLRVGTPVEGVLTEPVWAYDRLVLPQDAVVHGTVVSLAPPERETRLKARLNGDLTPLHLPLVRFTEVETAAGTVPIEAAGTERQTATVRFVPHKHQSIRERAWGAARGRWDEAHEAVFGNKTGPGFRDRALRLFYNQLPYHPQRMWRGTEFVADLEQPARLQMPSAPAPPLVPSDDLTGSLPPDTTVHARLVAAVSSDAAKTGEPVTAVVTEPVFDGKKDLVLPEGSRLEGSVLRAKPSRSFGRNGALRFTFRNVERADEAPQKLRGTVTGAQGVAAENLSVDDEGNVKAQPDRNRFVAPLLLLALAAGGHDHDDGVGRQVVAANGLGLVARVVAWTVASPNVATGFGMYGFAKSVYFRFLTRGHPVEFAKDTVVEVQFSGR